MIRHGRGKHAHRLYCEPTPQELTLLKNVVNGKPEAPVSLPVTAPPGCVFRRDEQTGLAGWVTDPGKAVKR